MDRLNMLGNLIRWYRKIYTLVYSLDEPLHLTQLFVVFKRFIGFEKPNKTIEMESTLDIACIARYVLFMESKLSVKRGNA